MRLSTQCRFEFNIEVPTPFVLMLRPRSGESQWVAREEYELVPKCTAVEYTDDYGNLCQRLLAPVGRFGVYTAADVETVEQMDGRPGGAFVEVQNLPVSTLQYLLPSRYCESEHFGQMAASITQDVAPGYDQVVAITQYVRNQIRFEPGSSELHVSAVEINQRGFGVCRDLAHLGIAMCRSLSIPARMVVGYLDGLVPMDLHAWFEAYVAGRWYTFDATQEFLRGGYVSVGFGRDAADVAVYNQFGPPVTLLSSFVSVQRID